VRSEPGLNRGKGVLVVSAGVLVISFDALLIRLAQTDNWNVVFWRGLFMAISLGLLLFARRGRGMADTFLRGGRIAWVSALFFGLGGTAFVSSVMFTKVANTVVIISSAPLFAAVFTRISGIESVPLRTWAAIASAVCGVAVVFLGSIGGGGLLGDAIALAAACIIGGNMTLLRRHPGLDRMPLICAGGVIMALVALPLSKPFGLEAGSYGVLALMGLVQMPIALFLIAQSTLYLPSPEVSLFLLLETVLAPIWVWFGLGESPPGMTFAGGGLILGTLVLHSWISLRGAPHFAPRHPR
jgi:drug/metabolite transporter (DMT)-like permease